MKNIFPKEIITYCAESHFVKFNSTAKSIYLLILIMVLLGIAVLPIVHVSITQQGRGVVRSFQENNNVISAIYGQVQENRLFENLVVNSGDTLVILNTQKIQQQLQTLNAKQELNKLYSKDLAVLINSNQNALTTSLYKNQLAEFQQKLIELEAGIAKKKKDYIINKSLFEKQVIPRLDFEDKEYLYNQAKQNKALYQKQKRMQWQNRLAEITSENMDYNSRIRQLTKEKEMYVIKAPVNGSITHFTGIEAGNFIAPNQAIAQISPGGSMMVECYISPSEIGYIRKDMDVAFQFDAFNYNQWGLGYGRVQEISPDVFQMDNSLFFKVRCTLDKDYLKLKGGYVGHMKKGMTLTARFKVARRTLFQLLYDKVDDWLNPCLNS